MRALGFVFAVTVLIVVMTMLHASAQPTTVSFVDNGPHGSTIARSPGLSPLAGAINAIVAHPTNPDVLWIGAVNGGVWKTTTATQDDPGWVPLTDHEASLSIGALSLDPTFATPTVLVAGFGGAGFNGSSFSGAGGRRNGLLRTTDGGDTWQSLGEPDLDGEIITGVAPRGRVIVVASESGLWRSHDTGSNFRHLRQAACGSGHRLPRKPASGLVGDPLDSNLLYAAMPGKRGGVFISSDIGLQWCDISEGGTFGLGANVLSGAKRVSLAAFNDGTHEAVYAGVLRPKGALLFRSTDRGATWTQLDNPDVLNGDDVRFMSMQVDPTSPTIVYVGGDGLGGAGGLIVRCDAAFPRFLQCESIAREQTVDNSAPHGDSRALQFDALGTLLDANDGGISRRLGPRSSVGLWTSLDGDLSITETHSCSWDHVGHVAICGAQDTGVLQQSSSGAPVWTNVHEGDGGNVAVSESLGVSWRYFSAANLDEFTRALCFGLVCDRSMPTLTVAENGLPLNRFTDPTIRFYTPIAAHPLHPERLVITTSWVYESDDGGNTLRRLEGSIGTPPKSRTIAFGSADHPNFLYVGSSNGLFRHTTKFGPMEQLVTYPGDAPKGVAVARTDSNTLFVVDADHVRETGDGGTSWSDLTFDLKAAGAYVLNTVAIVEQPSGFVLLVGANNGLFAMTTTSFGHWFKLHGKLPNAIVYDLEYDRADDLLLVTTLGRGTWTIGNPGAIEPAAGK